MLSGSFDINLDCLEPHRVTFPDQLHDLTTTNEATEQSNKILQLENNEYKQHIIELQLQISEYKQQLSECEQTMQEDILVPMLSNHLSNAMLNIDESQLQIDELEDTIYHQTESIRTLSSENDTLSQHNQKLRSALESSKKQIKTLKQTNTDTVHRNANTVQCLQNENEYFKQEINNLKLFHSSFNTAQSPTIQSPASTTSNTPEPLVIPDTHTPVPISPMSMTCSKINTNTQSCNNSACNTPLFVQNRTRARTMTVDGSENMQQMQGWNSPNFGGNTSNFGGYTPNFGGAPDFYGTDFSEKENGVSFSDFVNFDSKGSIDLLKQKIECLEFQNAELVKKLSKFECEYDKEFEMCEDSNERELSDIDECEEMELLFEKCDSEWVMDNRGSETEYECSWVEKYRLLKWEFQIRSLVDK